MFPVVSFGRADCGVSSMTVGYDSRYPISRSTAPRTPLSSLGTKPVRRSCSRSLLEVRSGSMSLDFTTTVSATLSSDSTGAVYRELRSTILGRPTYFQTREVYGRLEQGRVYSLLRWREGVHRARVIHSSSSSKLKRLTEIQIFREDGVGHAHDSHSTLQGRDAPHICWGIV
jgi:hypothetical protein